MRISDWSSDVCSSDLRLGVEGRRSDTYFAPIEHLLDVLSLPELHDHAAEGFGIAIEKAHTCRFAFREILADHLVAIGDKFDRGSTSRPAFHYEVVDQGADHSLLIREVLTRPKE